jgi:Arc/MetJ family transcription regulator
MCIFEKNITLMRTNVYIDDLLLNEASRLSKIKTKRAIVNEALQNYINHLKRTEMVNLFGKISFEEDLEKFRTTFNENDCI